MGVISLLSDFGLRDSYVSQMKAVILSISPRTTIIDISHEIRKYDVEMGAIVLASAMPYFPKGTIHVAVVDPGVGGERKGIIVETSRSFLVGPDNGVLMLGAEAEGVKKIYEITGKQYVLKKVSSTFHGRDIFAPVAAHLCEGIPVDKIGRSVKGCVRPSFLKSEVRGGKIYAQVIHIDSFGNIILNISGRKLKNRVAAGGAVEVTLGDRRLQLKVHRTYSDVKPGCPLLLMGSHGFLELAVHQGNASEEIGVERGDRVVIRPL